MADLAQQHGPITDRFPRPTTPEQWSKFLLDDSEVDAFYRDGYTAGISLLQEAEVDALLEQLPNLMQPPPESRALYHEYHANESNDPNTVLFHALGAWRIAPLFHDLLWHPALTVPAAQLLRGGVRFWHDQLFCKPPTCGGVVAWHQDYSYWTRTKPIAHLTCWIALDDTDEDNGCLQYVPGSHRWNLLPVTGLAGDMESIREVLTAAQRAEFQPVSVPLKRGQATIHHALTVHGSHLNRSARPRRATVVNLCRDGTCSDTQDPLLEGVPPIPPGKRLGGRFFPLLFDPQVVGLPIV
ncbi:MAG: phytanoyl-CoA dioxygenase family protein [Planctomycetota bacterium]